MIFVKFPKTGFNAIHLDNSEIIKLGFGVDEDGERIAICNGCNCGTKLTYYVPALNDCYCEECIDDTVNDPKVNTVGDVQSKLFQDENTYRVLKELGTVYNHGEEWTPERLKVRRDEHEQKCLEYIKQFRVETVKHVDYSYKLNPSDEEIISLSIGDEVNYVNDYGVIFEGYKIIALRKLDDYVGEDFIHLNKDSHWVPCSINDLLLSPSTYDSTAQDEYVDDIITE